MECGVDAILFLLISHADNPRQVLREVRRIVRPGGTIAVFAGLQLGEATGSVGRNGDRYRGSRWCPGADYREASATRKRANAVQVVTNWIQLIVK
jgi:SAM-dependent methyltransferase